MKLYVQNKELDLIVQLAIDSKFNLENRLCRTNHTTGRCRLFTTTEGLKCLMQFHHHLCKMSKTLQIAIPTTFEDALRVGYPPIVEIDNAARSAAPSQIDFNGVKYIFANGIGFDPRNHVEAIKAFQEFYLLKVTPNLTNVVLQDQYPTESGSLA